jgi:hypothetical protein
MKIAIDPMVQVIKRAERRINFHCGATAQDLAHDRKRQLAQQVADGGEPSKAFVEAAEIEGMSAAGLAARILAKQDVLMAVENLRRWLIVNVRAARTAGEVDNILKDAGVREHPADRLPGVI